MYLHLGQSVIVSYDSILGIFDLDKVTYCRAAAEFLNRAEREGRLVNVCSDLPKSFVVCQEDGRQDGQVRVYISQLSSATLLRRAAENSMEW